jgi:serine protease Do
MPVVAIGHPETAGLWTMTTGIVSSVVKDFQGVKGKDIFQTEASINRGNSGGPLLNQFGQMVGINTSISRRAADGLAITGINFSLKSSVPVQWLQRKDLVAVSYAKPGTPSGGGVPSGAVAAAEPPKSEEKKPSEEGKTYVVKTEDGSSVTVHDPEEGEEVADVSWKEAQSTANVSSTTKIGGQKPAEKKAPEAKILTERRPYKLDNFVQQRIKEIKALEQDMDSARQRLDERKGKSTKKSNGMGLW